MKRILSIAMLFLCVLHAAMAQVSRSNTKKSVPYRANYQRMSTSGNSYHNFEIRNGTLWGWGRNLYGEIGDGTAGNQRNTPVQIGTDNKWVTVATGGMHTLALKADGTAWAWGYGGNGQLGNGATTNKTTPVQIGTDNKWTSLVAGGQFSLGLKADGTLWAWGYNAQGQLGDGTVTNRTTPVQIGTDTKWTNISAGNGHALALKADGTLWAWGTNNANQIGDGTTTNRLAPIQIGTDTKWTNIAAGYQFNLALKANGTLWSWGYNANGQLGIGNTTSQSTPVQVGTDNSWVTISSGETFATALKANGTFWAWGNNSNGQLGDGTTVTKTSPAQIGIDNKWVNIFAGAIHTLALKADGTLWSWGGSASGQIGDGTTVQKTSPVQIKGAPEEWLQMDGGEASVLAIKSNGTLWMWGKDLLSDSYNTSRVQIGNENQWISVNFNGISCFALKADGTLWAWGYNSGKLGDGTILDRVNPIQIGTDNKWVSLSSGGTFTTALKSDGTLWSWGVNFRGQLGDGTAIDKNAPVQVGTDTKWTSISSGFDFAAALKSDGTLWMWGFDGSGQLGDGVTNASRLMPGQVGTDNKWSSVILGYSSTLALKADGSLWGWGRNSLNELGDGSDITRTTPILNSETSWINIRFGDTWAIGIKVDGSLWMWGYNGGQVGNWTSNYFTRPTMVGGSSIWVDIAVNSTASYALKAGRSDYSAGGSNLYGEIGNGTIGGSPQLTETNISLNCFTPNNSLIISGPATVCASATNRVYTVTNASGIASYTWTVPSSAAIVSGQGTATLTVNWGTTAGMLSVSENNGCGVTGTPSSIPVTIFSSASLPVISGPASVCPGAINQVFAVSNADAGRTYTWTVPTWVNIVSGQGTATLTVNWGSAAGTITVAETTCSAGVAIPKTVALATPNNALVVNGTVSVCSANNYIYTVANPAAGATYNWVMPSGVTIVSGQGTKDITVTWGNTNGAILVSETTACGTGTQVTKLVNAGTSYYALSSTDAFCGSNFAVPLKTIGTINSGIIGLDFAINYNTSLITPTGTAQTGSVATTYGSYSINTTTPGKVYVSVYLNNAPNGTYFSGNGDVAYVYFQVNTGVVAGTAFTLTTDGIEESTPVTTNMRCNAVGLNTTVKSAVSATLIYRSVAAAPLKYDPANPAAYVPSKITGASATCVAASTSPTTADLSGVFKFNPGNGASISIQRDINGDLNVPALNCTNVQAVINSMDRIQAADIATYKTTNVPIYTLLSADVNLDGKVTAGDVSLISSRSINNNNCEFPQSNYTWNGTALVPASGYVKSQDWLFVDDATLASAAFTTGTGRNNVPKVPACLPAPTGTASCTPTSSATYHAILLGDVDGSWTSANGAQLRTASADAVVIDLSQATVNAVGNYVIPVFYKTEGAYYGMDFSIDYTNGITVHQVSANTNLNSVGAEFNTIAQQRLMVTSYTQDPISTTAPVAYIEVSASSALTPTNFSNTQAYLNGQPVDLKFNFDDALAKNTAQVDIYPNPFHTETYIYAEDTNPYVSISIFDVSGSLVYEGQITSNERVVLNQLTEAGIYLVRVVCTNGTVTKKIVKI